MWRVLVDSNHLAISIASSSSLNLFAGRPGLEDLIETLAVLSRTHLLECFGAQNLTSLLEDSGHCLLFLRLCYLLNILTCDFPASTLLMTSIEYLFLDWLSDVSDAEDPPQDNDDIKDEPDVDEEHASRRLYNNVQDLKLIAFRCSRMLRIPHIKLMILKMNLAAMRTCQQKNYVIMFMILKPRLSNVLDAEDPP